jgi:tetratricopeptide (TPR) repeat protein
MHINLRTLTLSLALVLSTLFAGCSRNPQVRKQKFYNKGLEYLKKGSVNEARLQFLNALQIDPKYAEAASVLAEIQFRNKNYQQAYALLQRALDAKPEFLPARKGMAQLYRLSGKLLEAQKELEFVLEQTPDDIETLMNLGTLQAMQKKSKDAEGTFNRVLELQPNHVGALLALSAVSRETNDLPAAERFLKLALEKNPRSVPVYLALFKFYITTGRSTDLEPLFPQALKDTNSNIQILAAQDGFYEGANRLAEAEAVVNKIQTSHGSEPAYWGALADFYIRTNNWAQAKTELTRVLKQHKDDVDNLHKLIEVDLNMNGRKEAESLNNDLLKKNPKDSYAHLLKGRIELTDGNIDAAILEFNSTQKFRPDWSAMHFWLAQAYVIQGQLELAKRELETALTYDPDYRVARLILAGLQNRTGSSGAAMMNAVRLLQTNPRDVSALLVYSESLIFKKDYERAAKVLKVAAENSANNADIHRQLGILNLAKKNVPVALKEFRLAWDLQPGSKQLMENVVLGFVMERQTASGIDLLQQAIASRPNDAMLRVELAQMYFWRGRREDGIAALQTAMKLAPANPESYILLADVYSSDNKADQAIELLTTATQKRAIDSDLLVRAGMIYERLQRWNEARDAYQRSLESDSFNAIAKNNLASVLADHGGDLNLALTLAQQAKESMVDNLAVTNTLGWIYYKRQLYGMAVKYLEDCAKKDQKNATFQYEFGMTQWKLGHAAEARGLLVKALELDSHFPEAASAVATLDQIAQHPL